MGTVGSKSLIKKPVLESEGKAKGISLMGSSQISNIGFKLSQNEAEIFTSVSRNYKDDPWVKRMPNAKQRPSITDDVIYEPIDNCSSRIYFAKETVLQNSWWKDPASNLTDKDGEYTNEHRSAYSEYAYDVRERLHKRQLPPLPDVTERNGNYDVYGCNVSDHYGSSHNLQCSSSPYSADETTDIVEYSGNRDGEYHNFQGNSPLRSDNYASREPDQKQTEQKMNSEKPFQAVHVPNKQYDDQSPQECERIEQELNDMITIFRPLIVRHVRVSDILHHLPFIDSQDDIYVMAKSNPSNAVVDLLTELENCEVPNKWQQFVQVLRKCGYVYIVDNLRGYTFVGFEYQVQYIKTLAPSICPRIIPRELLPHLLAKELIKEQDKEEIQREELNFGSISASIMILDRVFRKQTYWYKLFVEALRNAGMDDIAGDLDIPELMVDKRCKVMKDRKHDDRKNIHDSRREKKVRVNNRSDNKSFLPTVPSRIPLQKNVACKDNDSGNMCERLSQDDCDCEIYIQREEATPTCNQPHNLNRGIDEEYTDENFHTQNLEEFDHDIRLGDVLPASDQPNIKDTKIQLNPKMPEISENGLRLGEVSPTSELPKVDDSDRQPNHSTPGSFEHGNKLAINELREIRELEKQRNELRNKNMFYTTKATLKKEIALEALKLEQFLAAEEMNETKDLPILIPTDTGNNSQKERCDATESNGQNRLHPHNRESDSGKYISRHPARKPSLNAVTLSQCELDQSKGVLLQERDSTFNIMMQILLNDS